MVPTVAAKRTAVVGPPRRLSTAVYLSVVDNNELGRVPGMPGRLECCEGIARLRKNNEPIVL